MRGTRVALALVALSLAAPVSAQEGAAIVVLGEVHDNPAHHARQAEIVARLAPSALVFEMLGPDQAAAIVGADRDDAGALADALGWDDSGWPAFELYAPIFAAAPDAAIFGAAVPRDLLNGLVAGATELSGYDMPAMAEAERGRRIAEQDAAHCGALPADLLPGMVDAQRLRDWWFADVALQALEAWGPPVVVITGTGHARTDVGVPAMIAHRAPEVDVWSLGQVEGAPPADAPFDAVATAPPVEREDPCAVFAD